MSYAIAGYVVTLLVLGGYLGWMALRIGVLGRMRRGARRVR